MTIAPIDVRDLAGHPGASRAERIAWEVEGLGSELATLAAGEPVVGDLLFESVVEGILTSGHVHGTLALRCARCLDEFERPLDFEINELFSIDAADEDADVYPLGSDGWLDPDQMVRDAIGLELPFAPLCRPECLGICGRCGGNRNLGECECTEPADDPRWAALEQLLGQISD